MNFPVLYEDEVLAVIRKPAGIHVHPTALSPGEPAVLQYLRDQLGCFVHPVHRLDRPTAGILVFAKTRPAAAALGEAFAGREVEKTYLALVRGWFPDCLEADSAIADEDGGEKKAASTSLVCRERHEMPWPIGRHQTLRTSLVEARPQTGRRHQIRRHLDRSNHPIIGDFTWGDRHHNHFFAAYFGGCPLQLFAVAIRFRHPHSGEWLEIHDPPQGDDCRILDQIRPFRVMPGH